MNPNNTLHRSVVAQYKADEGRPHKAKFVGRYLRTLHKREVDEILKSLSILVIFEKAGNEPSNFTTDPWKQGGDDAKQAVQWAIDVDWVFDRDLVFIRLVYARLGIWPHTVVAPETATEDKKSRGVDTIALVDAGAINDRRRRVRITSESNDLLDSAENFPLDSVSAGMESAPRPGMNPIDVGSFSPAKLRGTSAPRRRRSFWTGWTRTEAVKVRSWRRFRASRKALPLALRGYPGDTT